MSTTAPRPSYFDSTTLGWRRDEAHRALTGRTTTVEPDIELYPNLGVYTEPTVRMIRGNDTNGEPVSIVFHPDEWTAITNAVLAQFGLRRL